MIPWIMGRRLAFKLSENVLLTKGWIESDRTPGVRVGWFFNVYLLGRKTIYMGRRNGRFYCRGLTRR